MQLRRSSISLLVLVATIAACHEGGSPTPSSAESSPRPEDPRPPPKSEQTSTTVDASAAPDVDAGPTPDDRVPYQHVDVNHVLSTGQSNSVANSGVPVLSTAQPFTNLMFDVGVMPATRCDGSGCREYVKPTGFVPLVEGDRFFNYPVETMSSGLANQAFRIARDTGVDAAHSVLVSLHGRSGNTYWCLRKGSCNYRDGQGYIQAFEESMMAVTDAMALAKAAGKSYAVRAVTAIHGESDHYAYSTKTHEFPLPATDGSGAIVNDYADGLLEWQRDYENGVKAITGQAQTVPLLISQMDNYTDVPHSRVTMWQLDAHVRAPGKVVLVTPGYPLEWAGDCLHYTNVGERHLGEYFAKAYARIVLEGRPWEPVRPKTVQIAGNVITATFFVPKPPLVLDTTRVVDPGNFGFEYTDDSGAPPAITNVAVAGADTVTITLASPPTATGARLRYAYTAPQPSCPGRETGPRGNLRDSDDTPSNHGYELFNWGVHFDVPVTP